MVVCSVDVGVDSTLLSDLGTAEAVGGGGVVTHHDGMSAWGIRLTSKLSSNQ